MFEPLGSGEAVLIVPQRPYLHLVWVRDREGIDGGRSVDGRPPQPAAGAGTLDRHPLIQDRLDGGFLQPR